ncbi:NFACT RNA binding domain-containing protein [Ligilactobacillus ceti]|uniref:Rqc2 homolog RqcH n=1 Tax=Ligilactobacillus ceti DSM 22408 TaxID=1122146 RepID=A0A0R2KHL0_9LACO|nr:NFACT RNA binding domain-containing protein [Ligilactobacillus ceti]KRN88833.1 fibronectin-binding protein [Ligilactobacillus ceti DSM 22408]
MSFDGVFAHAMVHELNEKLLDGRVNKISQPYPNEIILTIRANRKNHPLLLSAHPNYARMQITQIPFVNPPTPTNFTMILRKYLDGAKLVAIRQVENDRIINLDFKTRDELGDQMDLTLSLEMMNRYSNIILINNQENKIIDTIRHISMDQNRFRTLLPGSTYRLPPKQEKINPFLDETHRYQTLVKEFPNREVLAQEIVANYQGFAYDTALNLADALHQAQDLTVGFNDFLQQTNHPTPTQYQNKGKIQFSCYAQAADLPQKHFTSLSELLDNYYLEKANLDRVQQLGSGLIATVKNELKKNKKKLKKLTKELKDTDNAESFKVKGELITTYLFQIKRGMTEVELPNYYDNEKLLKISLSNQLTPSQNAQKYFKKYQKLKNAVAFITQQIELTTQEINYLENIASQIELATPKDLEDIQVELKQEGYLKQRFQQKNQKRKVKISKPEKFQATDGTTILVGKNNLQNDQLTFKTAHKTDIWLHVKNLPGSHVIIDSSDPSEETLYEAAVLAAYYSKARNSAASVLVDYVVVKKVRKPNGSKPGFVIYEGQKTLSVIPSAELVQQLKA